MRIFANILIVLLAPAMLLSSNRWIDEYQRTQAGDWTFSSCFDGANIGHPYVNYFLQNNFAVGGGFNFNRNKTTQPNDDIRTNSYLDLKVGVRYEFCGDDSPVIGYTNPYLWYGSDRTKFENSVTSKSTTSTFGVGAEFGGDIYLSPQIAFGATAYFDLRWSNEKLESNGNSQDGDKTSSFAAGLNPMLKITWNFN